MLQCAHSQSYFSTRFRHHIPIFCFCVNIYERSSQNDSIDYSWTLDIYLIQYVFQYRLNIAAFSDYVSL